MGSSTAPGPPSLNWEALHKVKGSVDMPQLCWAGPVPATQTGLTMLLDGTKPPCFVTAAELRCLLWWSSRS